MTVYLRLLIWGCTLTLSFGAVQAQSFPDQQLLPDTTASRLAISNTLDVYYRFMGAQSRLLNGKEHIGYLPLIGQPYFQTDTVQTGSIMYEEAWYRDIPLQYDLIRDEVITRNLNDGAIALYNGKIKEFYLLGHHFINTSNGYFDLLCSGKMNLEVKRIKTIQETIESLQVMRNVQYSEHFYIEMDGVRHSISNLHSLFSFMKDKKKEINRDLEKKKIKYRQNHERALIEAVTYYNQSLHQ